MEKLIKLIKEAGNIALKEQTKMTIETKEDTSIVTNGDLAVSAFLEKGLKKLYPNFEVFSEENCKKLPSSSHVIVIDPIDGTESYSRKENTWSILVGFLIDNKPVAGIVYQPTTNMLYYASEGNGSYLEDEIGIRKIYANERVEKFKGYTTLRPQEGEIEFAQSLGVKEIERMYSAGLKIMEVAKANGDYYSNFRGKCSIWDLVAPLAILREAGGEMYFKKEMKFDFNKILMDEDFVVCNKRIKLPLEWKPIG